MTRANCRLIQRRSKWFEDAMLLPLPPGFVDAELLSPPPGSAYAMLALPPDLGGNLPPPSDFMD
ncbi:Melanoma inhibitory activity protein 2, partial [Clarias magur]